MLIVNLTHINYGSREFSADLEHEASVSKVVATSCSISWRGHSEEEAMGMIVNGFFEPFTRELPMEYAVELNRLLELEMEGNW